MNPPEMPPQVAEVFDGFPSEARRLLGELRTLIFATAEDNPAIGVLTETLKWGEPAYLTEETKSGSTVRLGWKSGTPSTVFIYFNCRTDLVGRFRALFGDQLTYEGNRAVALPVADAVPRDLLQICIEAALTYHLERLRP